MKKIDILFLSIIMFIAFGICMCLASCEFKPMESPQSSKIFHVEDCSVYYVEVTHDNHEYLISASGGIIHKVNCKFCINQNDLKNKNNNSY
jgi:hypothetical protein